MYRGIQTHYIKIVKESFENVTKFKHLETMVTSQNYIHEEIKRKMMSGNA
jgi:hypothetical protein